jgi:serine protease Do
MGFYKERSRRPSNIWIAIVSAIIGGLIVLLFTPTLIRSGIIDIPSSETESGSSALSAPIKTTVVESNITKAVEKARQTVVGVEVVRQGNIFSNSEERESGSGIIFEKRNGKALIVTNQHVIERSGEIRVVIPTDDEPKTVKANLLGADKITDLAVLEIDDQYVTTVAEFGNSDTLKAGEPAIAIGNPLGSTFSQSVTVGVISSPKRTFQANEYVSTDVIQTDAAINPGNSGGALINSAGQVIGINTLKIAETGVEGLGFAIPINDARPIIQNLIEKGRVPRPYIGVSFYGNLYQLSEVELRQLKIPSSIKGGVIISSVESGSPAAKANLQPLDVIVSINNQKTDTVVELRSYLYKETKIGNNIKLTFYRNGTQHTVDLTLTEAPVSPN